MSFIRFEKGKRGRRGNSEATVSISTKGNMYLNSSFCEEFLNGKSYCFLYYDDERKIIGIEGLAKKDATALKIGKPNPCAEGRVIFASSFCDKFKISLGGIYSGEFIRVHSNENFIELTLKQE